MALRLRVISHHAEGLGNAGTRVFGVHGGSIGRSPNNAWVLPDPERYLSGRHAMIEFRAGKYVVLDTSSNGTFVNSSQTALGKDNPHELADGDYLRLGDVELLVSIDASNDFPPDRNAVVAYDGVASSAINKSTANDIGADLDLSQLLEASEISEADSGLHANDAYGTSALIGRDKSKVARAPRGGAEAVPEPQADGTPWHLLTRPLAVEQYKAERAASKLAAERPRNTGVFDADIDAGLAAFCRGAGLDPERIAPGARSSALHAAGQVLREIALGLIETVQARREFKLRFHVGSATEPDRESLIASSRSVDEVLSKLLSASSVRSAHVDAVRGDFAEHRNHQLALIAAMHAALEELLDRLTPKELEERFERNAKKGVFAGGKARYWDLYTELFGALSQRPPDGFPHLFLETFARTYEKKSKELNAKRRPAAAAAPTTTTSAAGDGGEAA